MLTGMPISISLGLTVLTFLFTMTEVPIESVGLKLFSGLDNFGIMAIPFFILAGTFLTRGGVARRMIAFTTSLVGHLPGGLGLAGVAACAMFAAISGSSVATVVAIGSIMMPAMVDHGYPKRFGVGVISTSGALGILVPPSIILVLYGVSTNTSIGALFMAGIVPGVLLALMLAAVTFFVAPAQRLSEDAAGDHRRAVQGVPREHLGPAADRDRARRHLWRRLHADRGRRGRRDLRLLHHRVRLQGAKALRSAEGAAAGGEHELDAALHHHQRGAVLVPDDA